MKRSLLIASALVVFAFSASAFEALWARARCAGGHFSVLLPQPFHESAGHNVRLGGVRVATGAKDAFYIGGTPAPGINFLAAKLVFASVADARSAIPHFTLWKPPGYKRVYTKKGELAGLTGLESKDVSSAFVGYRRVLLSGETVFMFTVEAPAKRDKEVEGAVRKFFDSLVLQHK